MANKKIWIGLVGAIVLAVLVAGWLGRSSLLAWYCVHRLVQADEADRETWVEHVIRLEETAIPDLLNALRRDDEVASVNVRLALVGLLERWKPGDPRRGELLKSLTESFLTSSTPGQQTVLEILANLARSEPGPLGADLEAEITRAVAATGQVEDSRVRAGGLALVQILVQSPREPEVLTPCRELVRVCLQDADDQNRLQAIRLAMGPEIKHIEPIAPLLGDPVAAVRQAAMLAVGPAQEAIRTDELLPSLHDPDAEVRRLCEVALRSRGLRDEHIKRGRWLTDPHPGVRLQVLDGLFQASDLEPNVWLRHLSHDPVPAVRVAAIRAAAEHAEGNLTDRIEQIAHDDPSETVRQVARFYLSCQKSPRR